MQKDISAPFGQESHKAVKFVVDVCAAGGTVDLIGSKLRPKGLKRNAKCPCGSGLKVKKCHSNWLG